MCEGDFIKLFQVFGIKKRNFGLILQENTSSSHKAKSIDQADDSSDPAETLQQPDLPDIESDLHIKYADLISKLEKQLARHPEFPCCSCEQLKHRDQVTAVTFSDKKFSSPMWKKLKDYMVKVNRSAAKETHYVCQYCRPRLKSNELPCRCVLNGLEVEPVPRELESLDPLSKQLIQRAKAFQAVFRLGTYTGKVPSHNSLKACKGTIFFLPLPLDKTKDTLEEIQKNAGLPDPELFIIVNSKSKVNKTLWQTDKFGRTQVCSQKT